MAENNSASMQEISVTDIEMEKEPFARGGFGKVYMAKWREEDVVVKVINAYNHDVEEGVMHEANVAFRLEHPNIIKLFGITYIKRTKLGIVMEKAQHDSLDIWIGKIDREQLTKIALGIIDGLEYVHSQHVVHRDIKPKNILMCGAKDDMIPKIADFGTSKVIQTAMMTHTTVGHWTYMAPEVRMNKKYGFTADIFSLAMTLFEMFNEQRLSHASDEVKDFTQGLIAGRISAIPTSYKVPAYLRNVIERGWSEKPEERPTIDEYRSTLHGNIYTLFLRNIQRK